MTRGRRLAVAASVLVLLVAAAAAYVVVGSRRMEAACTQDAAYPEGAGGGVATDWSWAPPGFTCAYDDGTVRRSLWW